MIRVDPSPILFYFYFFYSIRVGPSRHPSWSDPEWRSELIRSDFCTCLLRMTTFHLVGLPIWTWSSKDVWFLSWKNFAKCGWKLKASWTWLHWCHSGNLKKSFMKDDIASQRNSFGWLYFSWVLQIALFFFIFPISCAHPEKLCNFFWLQLWITCK